MKTTRVVLAAIVSVALIAANFSNASAQQYKRHALIEEGTGTWCKECPWGAYTIDSMEHLLGANLVAISWHGPAGYGEPFWSKEEDTLAGFDGATGYPWASVGRTMAQTGAYEQGGQMFWPNPWSDSAQLQARRAPIVDFRVVNATYSSNSVDFDLDITPFDLTKMPTEDTAKYSVVAVVTEDGIVSPQNIMDYGSGTVVSIDNFVHRNVVRVAGTKVLGDPFVIKTAKTWPIRRHYHISTNNPDCVQDSLRIKAFAAIKGNKSTFESYLDAGQTGYITALPSTVANAVWTVLPPPKAVISGDSTSTRIVWGVGGNISLVKLEYSTNGGTNWNTIVASTSASPYIWQLPSDAYGQTITLRVSNAANASTTFTSPTFSIGVKPSITVISPQMGDSLLVGTVHPITYSLSGPIAENFTLEYSSDSMVHWTHIGTISNATTYNWTIPNSPSATAAVRVKDANGVIGISPIFAIVGPGNVINVTVDSEQNLALDAQTTIRWTVSGYLGESVDVDYLLPNGLDNYLPITHGLPATATSVDWNTAQNIHTATSGITVRVKYASGATGYSAPFNIGESNGVAPDAGIDGLTLAPNPFSGMATLRFGLSDAANVTLIVRDLLGREVLRQTEGALGAGEHEVTIDGTKLATGAYEYTLLAGSKSFLGKLTILR